MSSGVTATICNKKANMSENRLLNIKDLAAAIPMPVRTVQTLKDQRKIPFLRIGRRTIRYELSKVIEALQKFEVKAVS